MKLDLYTRMYLWLASHRRLVLGVMLLIAAAGVVISSRIDLEEDILATLPQGDKLVDDYRYSLKKFRQIDRVYIDVGITNDDPDILARAADEVHAGLEGDPDYLRVMYRFELGGQRKTIGLLSSALPNLFTEADAAALADKLKPEEVRQYLTVMRRKLAGPEGMVLKDVVANDPVGMSALVVAKALPLQTGFGDAQIVDGRITSADGRHVLIMAEPKIPSSSSDSCERLVTELLRLARVVEERFPGVHVAITGGHRMTMDNSMLIKGDATRCIFLGMGAMLMLCLVAYRRRWLAVISFLPSLFGTLMAAVTVALWQQHLSALAMGFATIAIGITVDYAIYVIYHLDNAPGLDRVSIGRHVSQLVVPITVGTLTTIAAFVVMATSPMHGYQQLGWYGAIGVAFSAAFALIILPLLVPVPKKKQQPPLWLTRLMDRFHFWQTGWRPWLLLVMLVITVASVFGIKRLRFEGDIARLNGITEPTRRDEELIRHTWGDALGMTLVVARGTNLDEALAQNDRAAEILSREPEVTSVFSLSSILPSRATQEANIRRWHGFWTPERREALHRTLRQVGTEMGFQTNAFADFWPKVEQEPALLTLDTFRGTPLEQALNERVAVDEGDTAVSTLLKLEDRTQVTRLQLDMPGLMILDRKDFAAHIADLARESLAHFALWTALVVAAIIYLSLMSVELIVATLLPLAFGLAWTFGMMGWLGLPIDLMNSVFVIFILGIGEDYSIFLVTAKLDGWRGRPQTLAATSAVGADLGAHDLVRIRSAGVRAASRPVLHGHHRAGGPGVLLPGDAGPDAVVHGPPVVQAADPGRAPLVAPAGHVVGGGASGRERTVPLLRAAAHFEDRLAAHGGRPLAPRHPLDGARRGQVDALRQTRIPEHHARDLFAAVHRHQQPPVRRGRDAHGQPARRRAADGQEARVRHPHPRHRLQTARPRDGRAQRSRKPRCAAAARSSAEGASVHFYPEGTRSLDGFCAAVPPRRVRAGGGTEAGHPAHRVVRHQHRHAARRLLVRAVPRHRAGAAARHAAELRLLARASWR